MRKRTGDWRDLLSAYSLALDAKKVYVGLLATVCTVAVMACAAFAYAIVCGSGENPDALTRLVMATGNDAMLRQLMAGTGLKMLGDFLPLFNPFHGGLFHLLLSSLLYVVLFWVWSGAGGVITRLTALEYARDDLPTLGEVRKMVRARRMAYFMAPVMPLVAILFLSGLNILGGLIASAWHLGRVLLIFPGFPLLVASTLVIVFLVVLGVLSFGLMMPAVSVGGKDGFESWSTAYSYVLWGLRQFVCYMLVVVAVGVAAAVAAWGLTELLLYIIHQTIQMGYLREIPWITYGVASGGGSAVAIEPAGTGVARVLSGILAVLFLLVRALPVAYVFSYFFTANTIVFFLMRKDQDNIEIDDIYEEEEEEEGRESLDEAGVEPAAEPAPEAEPAAAQEDADTAEAAADEEEPTEPAAAEEAADTAEATAAEEEPTEPEQEVAEEPSGEAEGEPSGESEEKQE